MAIPTGKTRPINPLSKTASAIEIGIEIANIAILLAPRKPGLDSERDFGYLELDIHLYGDFL